MGNAVSSVGSKIKTTTQDAAKVAVKGVKLISYHIGGVNPISQSAKIVKEISKFDSKIGVSKIAAKGAEIFVKDIFLGGFIGKVEFISKLLVAGSKSQIKNQIVDQFSREIERFNDKMTKETKCFIMTLNSDFSAKTRMSSKNSISIQNRELAASASPQEKQQEIEEFRKESNTQIEALKSSLQSTLDETDEYQEAVKRVAEAGKNTECKVCKEDRKEVLQAWINLMNQKKESINNKLDQKLEELNQAA